MKQKILLLLSLTLFILSFTHILNNLLQILPKKNFIDFFVYNGAVEKFVNHQNPYNFLYGQPPDKVPFNYPPSALLILLPLKLFPMKVSQIILVISSFLAFWLTFWVILKISKIRISFPHFLILLAFFNQTFPVKFTLVLGQINLIVLGLTYGALYLYQKSRLRQDYGGQAKIKYFLSILLFSLAASLKIFPLFTLPLLLLLKDFRFVFSALGIFIALNILPSINLFKQYYFQIVPNLSRTVGIPNFYDQSLLAFLLRLKLSPPLAKIITSVCLLTILILILFRFYKQIKQNSVMKQLNYTAIKYFSLIFALFSIGNLFSWQHHLIFAYPLILVLYISLIIFPDRTIWSRIKYVFFFLLVWFIFVFHFKNEASPLLENPFIASYQTITILFLIIYSVLLSV